MENILYNELLIRGYNVDVGVVGLSARTGGKSVQETWIDLFATSESSGSICNQPSACIPREKMQEETSLSIDDSLQR